MLGKQILLKGKLVNMIDMKGYHIQKEVRKESHQVKHQFKVWQSKNKKFQFSNHKEILMWEGDNSRCKFKKINQKVDYKVTFMESHK